MKYRDTLKEAQNKFEEMCKSYIIDDKCNCYLNGEKCKYNDSCINALIGFIAYLEDNYNVILEKK